MKAWSIVLFWTVGLTNVFADTAFIDFDLGLVFPQKLGGMMCDRVEKYDNGALGYTVFYGQGDFSAEISVYNLGREAIADGHARDNVSVVFQSVEGLQKRDQEQGEISNVRKRGSVVVPQKGDIQFANTVYQYLVPRVADGLTNSIPRIQSVYVTGALNNFFKVQFHFDVDKNKQARAMADGMVGKLVSMMKAKPSAEELLLAACDATLYNPADYGGRTAAQYVFSKAQAMGNLNVYTHLFVWPDGYRKPKTADLLIAAYFAGMLKVVVPQQLEAGGEHEAFAAMLQAYSAMRERDDIESIPQLDEWVEAPDKRVLFDELLLAPAEE